MIRHIAMAAGQIMLKIIVTIQIACFPMVNCSLDEDLSVSDKLAEWILESKVTVTTVD